MDETTSCVNQRHVISLAHVTGDLNHSRFSEQDSEAEEQTHDQNMLDITPQNFHADK